MDTCLTVTLATEGRIGVLALGTITPSTGNSDITEAGVTVGLVTTVDSDTEVDMEADTEITTDRIH